MKALLQLLKPNDWIFLIYQISCDQKTGDIEFGKKNPLPKNMTDFFKTHGVSMSKEERKLLQNFAQICNDWIVYQDMKLYLETTEDNETVILRQLLYMTHKLHKSMDVVDFFMYFMDPTKNEEHYAQKFNKIAFDYFQEKRLHEIERAIELIIKYTEAIAAWYEQTSVMTQVFLPLDKKYMEWFPEKKHAFLYSKAKEEYREKALREQEKINQYLKPPQPKTEYEPTEWERHCWSDYSDGEEDGPEWRDQELCSAEPHQCRCYLCISQKLLFCECPICLRKQAVSAEILKH